MTDTIQFSHLSPFSIPFQDRTTVPDEPGREAGDTDKAELAFAYHMLGYGEEWRDRHVDEHTAMTYSAVWACVRIISQTLASLGWPTYEKTGQGTAKIPLEDDVSWLLDFQANPEMSSFDWRQVMMVDGLIGGNGYSEIESTRRGTPQWLWPIRRDRVCPDRDESGNLVYEIKNGSGVKNTVMMPDEIFHLKGLGPDGLVGWSVIEMARKTIQLGMNEEDFGSKFFGRGLVPSGVLKIPGPKQTPDQAKETKRRFMEAYAGRKNLAGLVVTSGGMEFTPLTLPNTDAQFIESRVFSIRDVCRWFGVPPHKVADLERATFSNIEHQAIEFVQDCLLPWARRLESEADIKLYGRKNRGRIFTRLNLASLLRGDSVAQATALSAQVNSGIALLNEARELLDRNPVEFGDKTLVQGAMKLLEDVANPPEPVVPPPPSPAQTPPAPDTPADAPPQDAIPTFVVLLADAYGRLLRVESEKAIRFGKKGKLASHIAEHYGPENVAEIAAIIDPLHRAFLMAIYHPAGSSSSIGVTEARALAHDRESVKALTAGEPLNSDNRCQRQAREDLDALLLWSAATRPKASPPPAESPTEPVQPWTLNLTTPPVTVNVAAAEPANVIVNTPEVRVEPATVNVTTPPVTVNVPEQPAAVVNVAAPEPVPVTVDVHLPKPKPKTARKKAGRWIINEDE